MKNWTRAISTVCVIFVGFAACSEETSSSSGTGGSGGESSTTTGTTGATGSTKSSSSATTSSSTTTGTTGVGGSGGGPTGVCGWDPNNAYYECGFEGEDPGGTPIACPAELMEGAACGRVTGLGCCDANGDLWYCGDDGMNQSLVYTSCQ